MENLRIPKEYLITPEHRQRLSTPREKYNFLYYTFLDNDFCKPLMTAVKSLHEQINPYYIYKRDQEKIKSYIARAMLNASILRTYFDTHSEPLEQRELHTKNYINNDIQIYYLDKAEDLFLVDDINGHGVLCDLYNEEFHHI